jgi:hypothetical protein
VALVTKPLKIAAYSFEIDEGSGTLKARIVIQCSHGCGSKVKLPPILVGKLEKGRFKPIADPITNPIEMHWLQRHLKPEVTCWGCKKRIELVGIPVEGILRRAREFTARLSTEKRRQTNMECQCGVPLERYVLEGGVAILASESSWPNSTTISVWAADAMDAAKSRRAESSTVHDTVTKGRRKPGLHQEKEP